MASPFGRASLIVNMAAGKRSVTRTLDRVELELRARQLDYEVRVTEGPGDATSIARRVLGEGGRFLVAVGGDGKVHEVVNGLMGDKTVGDELPEPVLGVVAAGSGCDFVRTFGLPTDASAAASRLDGSSLRRLDVARIGFVGLDGQPAGRWFANIAEAGLGAETARRASEVPAWLGPSRYFVAFWAVLPRYPVGAVCVDVDGSPAYQGRAVNVVAANCRYFGGGMHIAPRSDPADGCLELLVFNGPKTDSFTMLPRVYRGRHLPHPRVVELQGQRFSLEGDGPMLIEADGEVLGTTPATIEVVAGALSLKV